jgi:hypothetical protein
MSETIFTIDYADTGVTEYFPAESAEQALQIAAEKFPTTDLIVVREYCSEGDDPRGPALLVAVRLCSPTAKCVPFPERKQ